MYSAEDDTGSDQDNDTWYGYDTRAGDNNDNWFYDYYDYFPYSGERNTRRAQGNYDYTSAYYDFDGDGYYDAYSYGVDQDGDGRYAELETAEDEPIIPLQKVEHESRVHLDIETDDLEAEAQRLEALGATRIAFVRERWWVMQAPTGHRFCVVRRQREAFGPHLNRWPD